MAIQQCPRCTAKVRVPDDDRQLKVRCPTCERQWFHPPRVEESDVAVRCAVTGGRMTVLFSRKDPDTPFTISDIVRQEEPEPSAAKSSLPRSVVKLLTRGRRQAVAPDPLPLLPAPEDYDPLKIGQRLIFVAARGLASIGLPTDRLGGWTETPGEVRPRAAREYDWTGFACPCCGDRGGIAGSSECGHLTCRGTVEERPGGTHWRCCCGNSGFLTSRLESINENTESAPTRYLTAREVHPALPAPETRQLPPPRKLLPAPDRPPGA